MFGPVYDFAADSIFFYEEGGIKRYTITCELLFGMFRATSQKREHASATDVKMLVGRFCFTRG